MPGPPNPFTGLSPRTPFGASGLGAVGGARGAGAGVLRYLVEFATTYNEGDLDNFQKALKDLHSQQAQNETEIAAITKQRDTLQNRLTAARKAEALIGRDATNAVKEIARHEADIARHRKEGTVGIGKSQKEIAKIKRELIETGYINRQQLSDLINENALIERQRNLRSDLGHLTKAQTALAHEVAAGEEVINGILTARQQLMMRLGALALGVAGGIVGAALLGPVLTAGQEAIQGVIENTRDMIDPAHRAKEAVKELGSEINSLVDDDTLTRLEAAQKYINEIQFPSGRGFFDVEALDIAAQATALEEYNDALAKHNELLAGGAEARLNQEKARTVDLLIQQATATGTLVTREREWLDLIISGLIAGDQTSPVADRQYYIDLVNNGLAEELELTNQNVRAAEELAEAAREAAEAFASIRLDALRSEIESVSSELISNIEAFRDRTVDVINSSYNAAIDNERNLLEQRIRNIDAAANHQLEAKQKELRDLELVPSERTLGLEKQLKALSDAGPSKRTRELAAAIEQLNKAEAARTYQTQLATAREEKQLLIFERRLKTQTEASDIDDYEGKRRVIAIDAVIEKLQKQAEAQARFNRLLEIQYELGKKQQRQEGETIREFIERRAQNNRRLLQEAAEINAQKAEEALQALKEEAQYEVDLADKTEAIKELIRKHALEKRIEQLQEELKASQKADREALEHRRETIQAQLEASRKADREALEAKREVLQEEMDAIRQHRTDSIEAAREATDGRITELERARDKAIETANEARDRAVAAEEERARLAVQLMEQSEDEKYRLAIGHAKSLHDLQTISGQIAGLNYSEAELRAIFTSYGLSPMDIDRELAKIMATKSMYDRRWQHLLNAPSYPGRPEIPGFAKGGIFPLTNAMNFGDNIRAGEEGTEWGMIFSNKMVQALKDQSSHSDVPLIGSVSFGSGANTKDMYYLKRAIREVIKEEIH